MRLPFARLYQTHFVFQPCTEIETREENRRFTQHNTHTYTGSPSNFFYIPTFLFLEWKEKRSKIKIRLFWKRIRRSIHKNVKFGLYGEMQQTKYLVIYNYICIMKLVALENVHLTFWKNSIWRKNYVIKVLEMRH